MLNIKRDEAGEITHKPMESENEATPNNGNK